MFNNNDIKRRQTLVTRGVFGAVEEVGESARDGRVTHGFIPQTRNFRRNRRQKHKSLRQRSTRDARDLIVCFKRKSAGTHARLDAFKRILRGRESETNHLKTKVKKMANFYMFSACRNVFGKTSRNRVEHVIVDAKLCRKFLAIYAYMISGSINLIVK